MFAIWTQFEIYLFIVIDYTWFQKTKTEGNAKSTPSRKEDEAHGISKKLAIKTKDCQNKTDKNHIKKE